MSDAIGLIGFGEVGNMLATGLVGGGAKSVAVFDQALHNPERAGGLRARAAAAGAGLCEAIEELVAKSNIILSVVTSSTALLASQTASKLLKPGQVYVDLNSVSPALKVEMADVIGQSGAGYVEGAIMAAVSAGIRVPVLVCGIGADGVAQRLNALGMNVEFFGTEVGRAAATKMFRSVIVKGLEALILECLLAASTYGVGDKVLDYVEEGYPGLGWKKTANYLVGRSVLHGERRAHEMIEVSETLTAMGIEPLMAASAAKRIASFAPYDLKTHFDGVPPTSYDAVFSAIRERSRQV